MHRKILYIIYKRLRPAFGLAFGFTLIYGLYINKITPPLLLAGLAFIFIETFGGLYNDYWDYEEDLRNRRKDKLTTMGILSRVQVRNLSFLFLGIGLSIVLILNAALFVLGLYWVTIFVLYCIPQVRLKGHIRSYLLASSIFFFFPFALDVTLGVGFSFTTLIFGLLFFSQFMYILCQKDSTDPEDEKNIFLRHGWIKPSIIMAFFASSALFFLLMVCLINPVLIIVWIFNLSLKMLNVKKIITRSITRRARYRLMLLEFLTPYLYIGGFFL
ncbi:MAG: UbiA family prenyltransferase [Candidatus Aenigmarchaeota archaeon]|nr:UbiA family prenyltransferase [Candidatus Aenigmarchaeota archaeon]